MSNAEINKISARESVRIDKELRDIKDIVERYDSYFYSKDPISCLILMRDEINDIFDDIFRRNPSQPNNNQ